jgi:hypothetical protein
MQYRSGNSSLLMIAQSADVSTQFTIVDKIGIKKYEDTSSQSNKEISIAELEAGEYLLLVETEKSKTVFRFFKD